MKKMQRYIAKKLMEELKWNTKDTKDISLTQNEAEKKGWRKEKQMKQWEIKKQNGKPKSSYI